MFINAIEESIGQEQYSDGAEQNTVPMGDLGMGLRGSGSFNFYTSENNAYFYALSENHGYQIFKFPIPGSSSAFDSPKFNEFLVYPNPAENVLRIDLGGVDVSNMLVRIIDISGKVMTNYAGIQGASDIAGLKAGI